FHSCVSSCLLGRVLSSHTALLIGRTLSQFREASANSNERECDPRAFSAPRHRAFKFAVGKLLESLEEPPDTEPNPRIWPCWIEFGSKLGPIPPSFWCRANENKGLTP